MLRSGEMATPAFAKVTDRNSSRGPQLCMMGMHTYNEREQKVHVFPVLDPSQEWPPVLLADCQCYKKGN
eukprot:symbB.v1.2.019018.t1/scaffold1538.1/size112827/7